MRAINGSVVVFVLAMLVFGGAPELRAADCDVVYRLWQNGQNQFFQYGEDVVLGVGEEGHLYIHYKSRSENPYSTSADIGAPRDFGVGGHQAKDIARVLKVGHHDARRGKIELKAVAAGRTGFGYRITKLADPGQLADVPANCRTGQVKITVEERTSRSVAPPPPSASSQGEAAHELITGLFTGILRRSPAQAKDYPNNFYDRVESGGLTGLIFVAETMTTSTEFRSAALDRTRNALKRSGVATDRLSPGVLQDQLLTDMCQSLYGGEPDSVIRRQMSGNLASCLDRRDTTACKRLGRDLVSQRHYYENNRDLLRHWQGTRR